MLGKLKYLFGKSEKVVSAEVGERAQLLPQSNSSPPHPKVLTARYNIGEVVHHRFYEFRGVIFDVDPEYANTEEWYESIPENLRPHRNQPYYHLFAENEKSHYTAYVSEQNLIPDTSETPIKKPDIEEVFVVTCEGEYKLRSVHSN